MSVPIFDTENPPQVAPDVEALVPTWWTVPDLAEALGTDVSRARQQLRDTHVPVVRRGERSVRCVPADFVVDGRWVKGLPGLFSTLADGRFEANETLRWLFTPDDSLSGTPMEALRGQGATEVKRRAQAMAL